MDKFLSFELPHLVEGAQTTLLMGLACIALATVLGALLGVLGTIAPVVIRILVRVYVNVLRGTPLLVVIFLFFFGLPFIGLNMNPYVVSILAISAYMGALISEIVRGAINSVPRGQVEAGRALGFEDFDVTSKIVLPQAFRYALPPYISLLPVTIKGTALASVVSVWELTKASQEVVSRTLDAFPVFGTSMLIYFILAFPLTRLGSYMEKRVA